MNKYSFLKIVPVLFLLILPVMNAEAAYQIPTTYQDSNASTYSEDKLEQLLAPIALYPDQLLTLVLAASMHSADIASANQWLLNQDNTNLQGDDLAAAINQESWDDSVKALIYYPQVLQVMSNNMDWTNELGAAAQQDPSGIVNAIQQLRAIAQAEGQLQSNQDENVVTENENIEIQTPPQDIYYVPTYDPAIVYGAIQYNNRDWHRGRNQNNTRNFSNSTTPNQFRNTVTPAVNRNPINPTQRFIQQQQPRNYRGYNTAPRVITNRGQAPVQARPAAPVYDSFLQGQRAHAQEMRGAMSRAVNALKQK